MADLIDRHALYDKMEGRYKFSSGQAHKAYGIAIDDICDAPAVDAVEVVRCKDCEFCTPVFSMDGSSAYFMCGITGLNSMDFSGFCSYGERRDDDG